jgi:hypothetical protein
MANLKDLIEDGVMKYDGFGGTQFGNLTVVGWNGKYQSAKKYIVECSVCKGDPELHGEGLFATAKGHLVRNCKPCGCAEKPNWTEEQYKIRCKRACDNVGLIFKGWANEFTTANKTFVDAECIDHGKIGKATISFVLDSRFVRSCRGCFAIRMGDFKRKDDSVMIERFMSSGGFSEGTKFTRSERLDKYGHKKYWLIDCPDCGEQAEGHIVGLYKGSRSCACTIQRPKETYINLIYDNENIVAIKFGVANMALERIKKQHQRSVYDVVNYGVWTYPTIKDCKAAERTCMHSMETGLISKLEMPDGYTETTHPSNMSLVIRIFEEYGGIRNI